MIEKDTYKNPPIFIDFLQFYKQYYSAYGNFPKIFRVTMGKDILQEISLCMKYICEVNFNKNIAGQKLYSQQNLNKLRASIELLKAYILFAVENKIISNGFFMELFGLLEKLSKQAASWAKCFFSMVLKKRV